jgi:hypothetical protein
MMHDVNCCADWKYGGSLFGLYPSRKALVMKSKPQSATSDVAAFDFK